MNAREIFEECGKIEAPDSVSIVSGMAADDAAEMIASRFDADGRFTDAFISAWALSVSTFLANASHYFTIEEADKVCEWFATRGINY